MLHQALEEELTATDCTAALWPFDDAFDHALIGPSREVLFSADFKDYTACRRLRTPRRPPGRRRRWCRPARR
ncbi:hypothetical protein ACGF0D_35170 [Kitasatospora sp. NPDC048298]|uniref:restriction endonuclease-related protein n=1 Tax=Kitasatospora sp. NPDC048298 TaxID=3364049 RepID=UPI00371CE0F0